MLSTETKTRRERFLLAIILIAALDSFGQNAATGSLGKDDIALRAMKDELSRSMSQLQLPQMDKPYFVAYRMQDISQHEISATLGSLTSSTGDAYRNRMISVELRVGDYSLDNSNFFSMQRLRGGPAAMFLGGIQQASLDDDYAQIRRDLWMVTDREYKKAVEDITGKKAALRTRNGGDNIPDLSKEKPTVFYQALHVDVPTPNFADLESMARELSAVFRSAPSIDRSSVAISYRNVYTRYVNSEGTLFTRPERLIKLEVNAHAQASDGLPISDSFTVYGFSNADLPAKDVLRRRVEELSAHVVKLRSASFLDRYNGPVLFEGSAAGEIFLQQFGSRLAASRSPVSDNSQFEVFFNQMLDRLGGASFQDKLGARVLPEFVSVRDEPNDTASLHNSPLLGYSVIDDDGVMTRKTVLVEHGILKNLLSSRIPSRGALQSTGSRRGWGAAPSNLFVESQKTMTNEQLRKELLRQAKDRGLDYGIIIRHVGGGSAASFMEMAKAMANQASSVSLPEVFKLYADGHEEPLRGVHIGDLPAESFKEIIATGDAPVLYSDEVMPRISSIFSGGFSSSPDAMPVVSCVTPSLLFEEVSLAKSEGPFPPLPVSPSPLAEK